jgi:cytosine/uracil/thiamine/allantoin permease
MAPLCAVIIADYVVRKGNIHVPSCYIGDKTGLYWFKSGINWSGVAAWLLGTAMVSSSTWKFEFTQILTLPGDPWTHWPIQTQDCV